MTKKQASFWKLPAWKKRVAIAKDVLKQIAAKKYDPTPGVYMDYKIRKAANLGQPLEKIIENESAPCIACALGCSLMSLARLGDKIILTSEVNRGNVWFGDSIMHGTKAFTYEKLTKIFGKNNMSTIESAFEYRHYGAASFERRQAAINFGGLYDPEPLLVAIMKNVIKNNGDFKP